MPNENEAVQPVVVSPAAATVVPPENEQITLAPEHVAEVVAPAKEEVVAPVVTNDNTEDEFEAAKAGIKVADVTKPAAEVKAEIKAEVKTPVTAEVKAAAKTTEPVKPAQRDYSGLPEDVVPLFKRMSNEAFEAFKPVYLKKAELEQKVLTLKANQGKNVLPESYLEHPLGYALSPDYEQAAQTASDARVVFEHWKEQLQAVQEGAATYKTLARDPKTGNIVYGAEAKVDKNTAMNLLAFFNQTQGNYNSAQTKLSELQTTYKSRHEQQRTQLQTIESSIFKAFEDPKHVAHSSINATIQELPPAYRNNPLARMVAKSLVMIDVLGKALQAERANKTQAATAATKIAETVKAAGPTATGAATKAQSGATEVTIDDFEKLKES